MSRTSQRSGRPTRQRDPQAYIDAVRRCQALIGQAGERWDVSHDPDQLVQVAAALRMLLVDGNLDQVVKRNKMLFVDSASLPQEGVILSPGGLIALRLGGPLGSGFIAKCEKTNQVDPSDLRWKPFKVWWNVDKAVIFGETAFTRRFLVTEMANTDSLHFDSRLDEDFARLTDDHLPDWTFSSNGGPARTEGGVAAASLRQIGWEVEMTLKLNRTLDLIEDARSSGR